MGKNSAGSIKAVNKHQNFISDRINKFDEDMLKHSKRNQKLVQENITLKNQVQKQDLQIGNL